MVANAGPDGAYEGVEKDGDDGDDELPARVRCSGRLVVGCHRAAAEWVCVGVVGVALQPLPSCPNKCVVRWLWEWHPQTICPVLKEHCHPQAHMAAATAQNSLHHLRLSLLQSVHLWDRKHSSILVILAR